MSAVLVADRVTRDMQTKLGPLVLDLASVKEMADNGQGIVIGNCMPDRTVGKIARSVSNLHPHHSIVACHSYDMAREVAEECAERGVASHFLDSGMRLKGAGLRASAIVTVPEQLYQCRQAVESGTFRPELLYLVDMTGLTMCARYEEEGMPNRASNVARFRGLCLAHGCHALPVFWTGGSPAAFFPETVCTALGVEATLYANGATVRTAFDPDETRQQDGSAHDDAESSAELAHPLDAQVTGARQRRSRLVLCLSTERSRSAMLLRGLSELRGYPQLSLKPLSSGVEPNLSMEVPGHRMILRSIGGQLAREIRLLNKQVVVLTDSDVLYRHVGGRSALFALAMAMPGCLLMVPGPNGLTRRDVEHLFTDIRRTEQEVPVPAIVETDDLFQ